MQLLKSKDIQSQFGISKSTLYRWVNERGFPKPIKFGSGVARWKQDEVELWLESQSNG